MICPYCHKEIPDSSTFCTECGKRLQSAYDDAAAADEAVASPAAAREDSPAPAPAAVTEEPAQGEPQEPAEARPGTPTAPQEQTGNKTDGLAVASLVCSIVGLFTGFTIPLVLSILGIIFGAIARGRNSNNSTNGKLALAGLVVGIVGLVLIVAIVAAVIVFGLAISAGAYDWAFN